MRGGSIDIHPGMPGEGREHRCTWHTWVGTYAPSLTWHTWVDIYAPSPHLAYLGGYLCSLPLTWHTWVGTYAPSPLTWHTWVGTYAPSPPTQVASHTKRFLLFSETIVIPYAGHFPSEQSRPVGSSLDGM